MKMRVNVNGVDYEVEVDMLEEDDGHVAPRAPQAQVRPAAQALAAPAAAAPPQAAAPANAPAAKAPAAGAQTLNSPIPGTVVEIVVSAGQKVAMNETVLILDAMKMNTPVVAPRACVVDRILVNVGEAVKIGQALAELS